MAIAIRSVTTGTDNGSSATVSLTVPATTADGDVVIVIHCNDYRDITGMPAPVLAGATPTMTPLGQADGGLNLSHIKVWGYVTPAGAGAAGRVLSVTETGPHDGDKGLTAYVLTGVDTSTFLDGSVVATTANALASTFPLVVTGVTAGPGSLLVVHIRTSNGAGVAAITTPASMVEQYSVSNFTRFHGAVESLAVAGATGTRTFTPTASVPFVAVAFALKPDGISLTGVGSTSLVGAPAVGTSAAPVALAGVASGSVIGQPDVILQSDVTVVLTGAGSGSSIGRPALTVDQSVALTGVGSGSSIGHPAVTTGVLAFLTGVASSSAVGSLTVSFPASTVAVTGVGSSSSVGQPAVVLGAAQVTLTGVASSSAVGRPAVVRETITGILVAAQHRVTMTYPSSTWTGIPTSGSTSGIGGGPVTRTIVMAGVASASTVGEPAVAADPMVVLAGVASASSYGLPMVVVQAEQLGAGIRASAGTVGYLGSMADLTVLNPGGSTPAGTFWDGNTLILQADSFVLDHYRVNGSIVATGSNPTVTNCYVDVPPGEFFGVTVSGSGKGTLTITDTTVVGDASAGPQVNGISSDSGLVARRCDVSGSGDGIHFIGINGTLVSQCYVHDLAFVDESQHCDGLQGFNHTSVGSFTVEHCYIGPIFSTIGTPCNSSLTFGPPSDNTEPLCTPTVDNNYFASGLYHLRCNFRQQNGTVTNNNFGPASAGEFGIVAVEQPTSVTTWLNNRDNTGTLIPQP